MAHRGFSQGEPPERLVNHLIRRLRRHRFWDCLIRFAPPLLAFSYAVFLFFREGLISGKVALGSLVAVLALLLGLLLRFGWKSPPRAAVARLIDDRVDGQDRFLTLATLQGSRYPSYLIHRLWREAASFVGLIDLTRDFPFRCKRSYIVSLVGSVTLVVLFHIFLQANLYSLSHTTPMMDLSSLAPELLQSPQFAELGRRLNHLEARIQERGLLAPGNEAQVRELLREVRQQMAASGGRGQGEGDVLGRAMGTLERLAESMKEGKGIGSGSTAMRSSGGNEDGAEMTKLGAGEGNGDPARGRGSKAGLQASRQARMSDSKTDRGNRNKGTVTQGRRGDGREGHGNTEPKVEAQRNEKSDPQESEVESKIPQRYYQAGERREKGIEGARFVIVEIPQAEGDTAATGAAKSGKGRGTPKVPVSNVPLPPRSPQGAPSETQQVPLEYRRILR